jgi:tRNA(fMet)-specific endonuclease VapC
MKRILLDTSAYSAFMRGHDDIRAILQEAEQITVTPVVLGELYAGFARGRHRRKNERELHLFLSSARVRLVGIDDETAERYAVIVNGLLAAGTPIPTNDIWIAASAMQYGVAVVTTDEHYEKVTQVIVERFSVE